MAVHEHNETAAPVAGDAESELLARLRNREPAAYERFVRAQVPRALAVARRILGDDADAHDAVQDAFVSFLGSLASFRQDASLSTWLHRIVLNAALMKRRSRRRGPETNLDELLPRYLADGHRADPRTPRPHSPVELLERDEVRERVRRKINELPEEYRNVVLLRDIEQLDTEETARLLGDTPGAVKTRLHRARQALRTLLERESVF